MADTAHRPVARSVFLFWPTPQAVFRSGWVPPVGKWPVDTAKYGVIKCTSDGFSCRVCRISLVSLIAAKRFARKICPRATPLKLLPPEELKILRRKVAELEAAAAAKRS